jgi:hypothetical protein
MRALAPILLLALAACGADGEPETPAPRASGGVVITGTAELGVSN